MQVVAMADCRSQLPLPNPQSTQLLWATAPELELQSTGHTVQELELHATAPEQELQAAAPELELQATQYKN
ncbi:hypothetical protein C0Q70_18503 [Pomacea canaliculata]|uniref:Uncharacterized protein n=1 Tax=Pomacea canaliculata TaxID=400727 RepID=A0A2T7NGQ0_POMCA|nr:hypothetical protein C0Q70_18503 [Pomacea canaliculata]